MLISGKLVETGIEIVANKLIDVLGDRAGVILNRDKTRAASYDAYYALRRIEDLFGKIEDNLRPVESDPSSAHSIINFGLPETFREIASQLEELKKAFAKLQVKMEIYQSVEDASKVRLYFDMDEDILSGLLDHNVNINEVDISSLIKHMIAASAHVREVIAKFIRDNYKIDQNESGT